MSMMSDQMMRRLRVQLTTTMDSVLRKAVFEVMTIFENTLHDHQMEMAHKGEEVAQLKIKLQAAELRLKDFESSGNRGIKTIQTQAQPPVVLDAPKPTSEVPGIDVDVPDDWCAPLGCEVVTKEEEGVCPSVRLRQFSIPLYHIPLWKHKDDSKGDRRSRRISALNATSKLIRDGNSAVSVKRSQSVPTGNDMQRLLQDMTWVYSDLAGLDGLKAKKRRKKEQAKPAEHKVKQSKHPAVQSKSDEVTKVGNEKYPCKFCNKVLDTEFGRKMHIRLHRKCRGCNKMFPYPSDVKYHQQRCPVIKKLLKGNPNIPKTCRNEEGGSAPCRTQLIKAEDTQSSGYFLEDFTKRFSCQFCDCKFEFRSQFKAHLRRHRRQSLPIICRLCLMKFVTPESLVTHMMEKHKNQTSSSDVNRDLEWTKPLEDIYHDGKKSVSPRKHTARKKSQHAVKIGTQ